MVGLVDGPCHRDLKWRGVQSNGRAVVKDLALAGCVFMDWCDVECAELDCRREFGCVCGNGVDSSPFVRRVVGSNPASGATYMYTDLGQVLHSLVALRRETPTRCPCCVRSASE